MDQHMVLMVGSGFRTKGVDRAIRSLASLDPDLLRDTFLIIVGADNPKPFLRLAARLGVRDHVKFMGGRENVPMFFVSADLLIHPAYRENTGTVLLEAMLVGLPVLATDICGYGSHIASADAGELVPSPFRQETLNHLLQFMLQSEKTGGAGMESPMQGRRIYTVCIKRPWIPLKRCFHDCSPGRMA